MPQINIHLTPAFEKELRQFMKIRHINNKSEAIRVAIHECIERATNRVKKSDFSRWLGIALKAPLNKKKKFSSDDDLWK